MSLQLETLPLFDICCLLYEGYFKASLEENMEYIKDFLESSTIHGLSHIAKTRKFFGVLWICTVVAGFVFAGYIINESFNSWAEYPVKTITETLPINNMRFPKVTVCPPKNTKTNLNFDLMMLENKTISNATRFELYEYAIELLMNETYKTNLEYLQKLDEEGRYQNWYHGITSIDIPNYNVFKQMTFSIWTSASTGTIRSQFFGDRFNLDKVEKYFKYTIQIIHPEISIEVEDIKFNVYFQRIYMKELEDKMDIPMDRTSKSEYNDTGETIKKTYNIIPGLSKSFTFYRKVSLDDFLGSNLTQMPGFELSWNFSKQIDSDFSFAYETRTQQYLRF